MDIKNRLYESLCIFRIAITPYQHPLSVLIACFVTFMHALPVPKCTYASICDAIFQWLGNPRGTDLKLRSRCPSQASGTCIIAACALAAATTGSVAPRALLSYCCVLLRHADSDIVDIGFQYIQLGHAPNRIICRYKRPGVYETIEYVLCRKEFASRTHWRL